MNTKTSPTAGDCPSLSVEAQARQRPQWRVAKELAACPSLNAEVLLSTPLSIVVRARLEFADARESRDTELVIARQRCQGDRPSGLALLAAARCCVRRLAFGAGTAPRAACRLLACIDGRWQLLLDKASGRPAPTPH